MFVDKDKRKEMTHRAITIQQTIIEKQKLEELEKILIAEMNRPEPS